MAVLNRRAILAFSVALAFPSLATADEGKKLRIAMVGDSTMASYPKPPKDRPDLTGWGQVFDQFFTDKVEILNHAASGRSTKSFIAEGRWKKVLEARPDYVFIQFGHNDQKDKTLAPNEGYREHLIRYIEDARQAGIKPVLVTPVARRTYKDGKASTTLTPFADAAKKVAKEKAVPVIDLHQLAFELFDSLGDDGSADFNPAPADRTHFSKKGALAIAGLVAKAVPSSVPDLKTYLKK